ncbi:YbaN family protein [Sphingosinicella sp. LY1275]|uniref:YbaN family protein n=1 Tax=Sphingosinicella sp. LY1275 TaxID=3095379 RepID=UPI002ADEDA20|nr:YbaN family protein [Sphingosinicella sp. LY1275]MEA1015475.1 YbaN family protein [Sphingosinicella sp. LY1275]
MRLGWRIAGLTALALGAIGAFLPLLPTVPFILLAAFCFARSNPEWEQRLLDHPRFGRHIHAWRTSGSISRKGKAAAVLAFAASAVLGLATLQWPWAAVPLTVALVGSGWILSRPTC